MRAQGHLLLLFAGFGTTFAFGDLFAAFGLKPKAPVKVEEPPTYSNAVLVAGATGQSGREVVEACLASGRQVVALIRDEEKAKEVLPEADDLFLQKLDVSTLGKPAGKGAKAKPITVNLAGVSQVVSCLGPTFKDGMTSEAIDYKANVELITAAEAAGLSSGGKTEITTLDDMTDVGKWSRLDDVIMGGTSSSSWKETDSITCWSGRLITEGGGFCGTTRDDIPFDPKSADGIKLRVRGDGQRYKLRLNSLVEEGQEVQRFQASFDTEALTYEHGRKGEWQEVTLPWSNFHAVSQTTVKYSAPGVTEAGMMSGVGLVLSRFQYNSSPNPKCKAGDFRIEVGDISLYKAARPSFVLMSSGGAERFNRIESDEERAADIPIVKLNPQGILNWKYKAEAALRETNLDYCVIRPTALMGRNTTGSSEDTYAWDLQQGDEISGLIGRNEVAQVITEALSSPFSSGKTFELRRGCITSSAAKPARKFAKSTDLFRRLVLDKDREVSGLRPFPRASDPPPELGEEEKAAVVEQAMQEKDAIQAKAKALASA